MGSPITVGASPTGVAVSGESLYVANTGSNTVTVINTKTNKVVGSPITVGASPTAVAVSGKILYVANTRGNTVTVINTAATNTAPVVGAPAYSITTVHPDTGRVDGSLHVTDPDGDPLTYTSPVTSSKGGIAVVSPTGAFVYTPTAAARHIASAVTATPADKVDSFTVRVTDGRGGTTPVTVSAVPISPTNAAPASVGPTVATPDATGVVTGSLNVTDPDGDALSYTSPLDSGKGGTVTVDSAGSFTYTPTAAARHDASAEGATPADRQDTFAATVADGHGGTTTVPVNVVISPANTAPAAIATVATLDPATGVVSGSITASDPDADPLSYTVTAGPAGGTVTLDPDGTFTYHPTDASRLRAGLTAGPDVDSFTVTIGDGHGGVVPITVDNVTVSPTHTTLVGFIGLDYKVWPVVFSPVTNRAYFGYYNDYPWGGQASPVTVVDTTTDTVIAQISMPQGGAVALAVSPDGTRVYAPNLWSNYLTVIDTGSNSIVATIPIGTGALGVAITSDGQRVYLSCNGDNAVKVLDTTTNAVIGTIPATGGIYGIAVSPDGSRVYTANSQTNSVSVIDTAANAVITAVPVGIGPHMLAVTPDGSRVHVPNRYGNTVSVIDTATNTAIATVPVGAQPYAVAISPDGSIAYVTNAESRTLSLIDTATNTVISTIPLGGSDTNLGVAVSPDGRKVYATNAYSYNATVITVGP